MGKCGETVPRHEMSTTRAMSLVRRIASELVFHSPHSLIRAEYARNIVVFLSAQLSYPL